VPPRGLAGSLRGLAGSLQCLRGDGKVPIVWGVDHRDRLVVVTVQGVARYQDIEEYLDSLSEPATRSFRKIFDIGHSSVELTETAEAAIGARIRDGVSTEPVAPVAIVAVADQAYTQLQPFEALAGAIWPLKVFRDLSAARRWLDAVARAPLSASPPGWMPSSLSGGVAVP
jgi:hypothetical protein